MIESKTTTPRVKDYLQYFRLQNHPALFRAETVRGLDAVERRYGDMEAYQAIYEIRLNREERGLDFSIGMETPGERFSDYWLELDEATWEGGLTEAPCRFWNANALKADGEHETENVTFYDAERFQQLYLTPREEGMAEYREIARKGKDAKTRDLSHFIRRPEDSLTQERTPAGAVDVVCIHERADFERFLQIMAKKCEPVSIPATQGAAIIDGLIDWGKIRAHRSAYFAQTIAEGGAPDWNAEFARFRQDKRNYTTALIALSWGPYSGLAASCAGFSEADWLAASHVIRKRHECTHFLCRRLYPGKIDAVWDELVADAVGLLSAFGDYRSDLALRLLGISQRRYIGGRLENYVSGDCTPKAWLPYCQAVVAEISDMVPRYKDRDAYHLAVALEERKEEIEVAASKPVAEKGERN